MYSIPQVSGFCFQNTECNHITLTPSFLIHRKKYMTVLHTFFHSDFMGMATIGGNGEQVTPSHQPPAVSLFCLPSSLDPCSVSSNGTRSFPLGSTVLSNMLIIYGKLQSCGKINMIDCGQYLTSIP